MLADVGHCPVVVGSVGCTLNTASEPSLRHVDVKGKSEVKYTAFTRHTRGAHAKRFDVLLI